MTGTIRPRPVRAGRPHRPDGDRRPSASAEQALEVAAGSRSGLWRRVARRRRCRRRDVGDLRLDRGRWRRSGRHLDVGPRRVDWPAFDRRSGGRGRRRRSMRTGQRPAWAGPRSALRRRPRAAGRSAAAGGVGGLGPGCRRPRRRRRSARPGPCGRLRRARCFRRIARVVRPQRLRGPHSSRPAHHRPASRRPRPRPRRRPRPGAR